MSKNKKELKGLGDLVERVTETTGIKRVVEGVTKGGCGCDKRRDKLNEKFPFKRKG
tara:strand:+ start:17487 stop:17654 length:168 start_codon:yes stop_codon:yes gene_type:complete